MSSNLSHDRMTGLWMLAEIALGKCHKRCMRLRLSDWVCLFVRVFVCVFSCVCASSICFIYLKFCQRNQILSIRNMIRVDLFALRCNFVDLHWKFVVAQSAEWDSFLCFATNCNRGTPKWYSTIGISLKLLWFVTAIKKKQKAWVNKHAGQQMKHDVNNNNKISWL